MTIPTYVIASTHHNASDDEDDDLSVISTNDDARVGMDKSMLEFKTSLSSALDASSDKLQASINRWNSSSNELSYESCHSSPPQAHSSHLPETAKLPRISTRSNFSRRLSGLSGYSESNGAERRLSNSSGLSSLPRSKKAAELSPVRGQSLRSLMAYNRPKLATTSRSQRRSVQSRLSQSRLTQSQHSHCSSHRSKETSIHTNTSSIVTYISSRCGSCPPQLPQRNRSFAEDHRITVPTSSN